MKIIRKIISLIQRRTFNPNFSIDTLSARNFLF